MTFAGGAGTITAKVINESSGTITLDHAAAIFNGSVDNEGTFVTIGVNATFTGAFTNNGVMTSDPSTLKFGTLTEGANASVQLSAGDVYQISGDFLNQSTQNTSWNTSQATLEFVCPAGGCRAGADHTMDLPGANEGATAAGYVDNFEWGELEIDPGNLLVLADGNSTSSGAFYAGLVIGADISGGVVTNIVGAAGLDIYYDPKLAGNDYLDDKTYALTDGGYLVAEAAAPEPKTWVLMALGFAGLGFLGRRAARARATAAA